MAEDDEQQNAPTVAGAFYDDQQSNFETTGHAEFPFPNNFLEQPSESNGSHTERELAEQQRQAQIMSGDMVPEPAEYCEAANEITFGGFEPFQQTYVQQPGAYQPIPPQNQQYANPWTYQQVVYEEYDPYAYSEQPTSSSGVVHDNPFEEEEDEYEPQMVNAPRLVYVKRMAYDPSQHGKINGFSYCTNHSLIFRYTPSKYILGPDESEKAKKAGHDESNG
jgi:hypothetical protein